MNPQFNHEAPAYHRHHHFHSMSHMRDHPTLLTYKNKKEDKKDTKWHLEMKAKDLCNKATDLTLERFNWDNFFGYK